MAAMFHQLFALSFLGLSWYNEYYNHDEAKAIILLLWAIFFIISAIYWKLDEKL